MTITVLVTSYGRPAYLERCLDTLAVQNRTPDQVVVVTRSTDGETEKFVEGVMASRKMPYPIAHGKVSEPGVLAANRVGLPLVTGEILSFIDDDAGARPDWLEKVEKYFLDHPDVGAVGGRDLQHTSEGILDEPARTVGRVFWYGRIVGNHHRRLPGVHEVEVLKGCNMSFRRELVQGFDRAIIGNAHYYEMDLSFAVKKAGYRMLWDGDLVVDHYQDAPRYLTGNQDRSSLDRIYFLAHNRVYVMMKNLPFLKRLVFLAYTLLTDVLGLLRHREGPGRWNRYRMKVKGMMAGIQSYRGRGGHAPGKAAGGAPA